ncbi:site-specific DNA-methyltransferase [Capnocytophaga gingivalis]|jgi:DNA methylase N-4/N-6 domain protein|uniref:Methyltransferase n=1 Tax=Capnocytophaga gingivalis TaxID=1017 RepID=A0ABU5Z5Z7_9FLAO|nr:site-specific DNA-methyltransferase [Capnocytophaga gingivalis]MEB3074128.1 site-specific DNA-methyltransferase [Capnocytophaga gingivalis]
MTQTLLKQGDCISLLKTLPSQSIQQIFADPPYNLSGNNFQTVKSGKFAPCDKGEWDMIGDIDLFNQRWIEECVRVLSDDGTIWISGTLHNHPSIGVTLKKLGLWIINDIIWFKRNAAPLLSKNRLAPSTELIWVASKTKKYYFDYEMAKAINGGKQMRNLWEINAQRHLTEHPTEKPEILLERILLLGSQQGDTVLDPFLGSGTTGVVAKRLKRNFIGFELSPTYFEIAKNRIDQVKVPDSIAYSAKLLDEASLISL